jgi:hypothetical protein
LSSDDWVNDRRGAVTATFDGALAGSPSQSVARKGRTDFERAEIRCASGEDLDREIEDAFDVEEPMAGRAPTGDVD